MGMIKRSIGKYRVMAGRLVRSAPGPRRWLTGRRPGRVADRLLDCAILGFWFSLYRRR
jgi:hypothetical protein